MPSVDADAVASATLACPSVAGLTAGTVRQVATYLPGRRIEGVRIRPDGVEVHVVARWRPALPEVGDEVRAAVQPLAPGLPVSVYIDDIEAPGALPAADAAAAAPATGSGPPPAGGEVV